MKLYQETAFIDRKHFSQLFPTWYDFFLPTQKNITGPPVYW